MTLPASTCRVRKPPGLSWATIVEQLTAANTAKNEMYFIGAPFKRNSHPQTDAFSSRKLVFLAVSTPGPGALDQLVDIGCGRRRGQRATGTKDVPAARREHFESLTGGRFHGGQAAFVENSARIDGTEQRGFSGRCLLGLGLVAFVIDLQDRGSRINHGVDNPRRISADVVRDKE